MRKNGNLQKLLNLVCEIWNGEKKAPLKVSVMGQTGVGKSSLINALFNTKLDTDPVRPATSKIPQRGADREPDLRWSML
jgi:predicted GTPase